MNKRFLTVIVGVAGSALLVTGCAPSLGSSAYARTEARRVMEVKYGVIEAIRPVQLEGTESGAGTLTGALLGGLRGTPWVADVAELPPPRWGRLRVPWPVKPWRVP
ncbi:hypothetical protein [Hydrogenophilus thermoluteolus]|uniref:hypothetical protein n=1 Tax=Hydrogenophilus thermoluteolus TaxID=297 RepID=UPI003F671CAC